MCFASHLGTSMCQEIPTAIYTSPFMADIQTGMKIVENIPLGVRWNIEPGLAGFIPDGTEAPKLDINLGYSTVMSVDHINRVLGKESKEEFYRRISCVLSKLDFSLSQSTMIVADADVIDAIIQEKVRCGQRLRAHEVQRLNTHIPCLSIQHFDISSKGEWRPSAASIPGLLSECDLINTVPNTSFLVRINDGI
ncbi:hypothetical protein AB6A40_001220 [Gnathostoma spinigerum]|uniref:Uncharacterized protein n=1 Tax=Gnathostoma spinigerum TaxID=75299 RepID=A0ABD6E4X7_9BILA